MRLLLLLSFVLAGVLFRWIPHPPNFTPLLAMSLFAGVHFHSRTQALAFPLLAIWISDLWLGFYPGMWAVYLSYALIVVLGIWMPQGATGRVKGAVGLAGGLTLSAFLFFFISNLGVWATGILYPRSLEGLWTCYVMAVPFFPATLYSTWLYGLVLFGGWALLGRWQPQLVLVPALSRHSRN